MQKEVLGYVGPFALEKEHRGGMPGLTRASGLRGVLGFGFRV